MAYTYADIEPIRSFWWGLQVFLSTNLVICVPALALAGMLLVRQRGARWATVGGVVMWVGTALYTTGVAGLATIYYFATDPGLDPAAGTVLLDLVGDDGRLYAAMIPGGLLVALGTVLQAVGLWRARSVPRWVPLTSLAIVATFVLPASGAIGLVVEIPVAVAACAVGYYAWRRA